MKFIREIATKNITELNVPMNDPDFILVWKEESVEIWLKQEEAV